MINLDGEVLVVVCGTVAGLGVGGLVRAYIRHRTRLYLAREMSARTEARARGLVRLIRARDAVVIEEKDVDGHRVIEIGSPADRPTRRAA